MQNSKFVSALARNQFPAFFQEEGPNFLAFIEAYYEFMEQQGGVIDQTYTIEENHDIDETLDTFIEYFRKDIIPSIPDSVVANKRLLAKHIKDFYQSRGTLSAYKLLFRILFNEDVEINYPSDQILKVSDGDWRIDRYLVTRHQEQNYNLIGQTVTGLESGAFALVEDVVRRTVRGRDVDQMLLSNINGFFVNGEFIEPRNEIDEYVPVQVEAGIHSFEILSGGADYVVGDTFDIVSDKKGIYGKVIVTEIQDKKGVINFTVRTGGSGYTSTVSDFSAKTKVLLTGADSIQPASFEIYEDDLTDKFAITVCTTTPEANTVYGDRAPLVPSANGSLIPMDQIKDIAIGAPAFGIPQSGELITAGKDYRDHSNAVITIANTKSLIVTDSIYGDTSGANGYIKIVRDDQDGDATFIIDGYLNFQTGEDVRVGNTTGNVVGTVSSFTGNTIGHHIVTIGNNAGAIIQEEDELIGQISGAYGVVKKIITINTGGYDDGQGDVRDLLFLTVTSNNTSNTSSYFGSGAMKHFIRDEGVSLVTDPNVVVGNVSTFSANTAYKNQYTPLGDLMEFVSTTIGTIQSISEEIGGSGYRVAPTLTVVEPSIKALGIGEVYLTIQNTAPNWSTGNTQITTIDSNDRIRQTGGVKGDVKQRISTELVPSDLNGREEIVVRVWQDQLDRYPGNLNYANGQTVIIDFYEDASQSAVAETGEGLIVAIDDRGILGDNADIDLTLGANGSMTAAKVIDSGYSYDDAEVVEITESNSFAAQRATVRLSLLGVANAEGYYTTSRSHLSSKSGYIQDSRFYQEFSYEVLAPLAIERYRDIAKLIVHPSGQALFGRYVSQSDVDQSVTVESVSNSKRVASVANVSIANSSKEITFSANVASEYSNGDYIIIETEPKVFRKALLNIVNANGTYATITSTWNEDTISDANAYYTTGSIS